MARTIVKQVRLRGKQFAKEAGWLDIKLSLELIGKEYFIIPYYANGPSADKVPGNLIGLNLGKKKGDFLNFTDDDFIKYHLDNLNAGKAGAGSYLDYYSVPADLPIYPEASNNNNYTPGKVSKNVYTIIQDAFDPLVIPEEDEDLKTRRKLWEEYDAAKKVADPKKPITGSASNSESATAPVPDEPRVDPLSVTGKLFVKKKSGPGEITGITEAEIVNANVVFKDLQFTDPGFYVITISHGESSTLVDPIDVSIEVLAEEVVTPQEESKGVETDDKITGNRPIIAQIDKPEIVIKEMVQEKDKLAGENNQASTTQDLGFKPYLEYNGSIISESDISSLTLYHDGILPKIKFNFKDTKGIIAQHEPMADSTMELFLNPGSSNLKPIHFVFNLLTCVQIQKTGSYDATGTIYVPDLYKVNNNSYMGTSFEAIRRICKDLKLGFNSNINQTNDAMSWRNPNTKPHEFIEEIIAHSYIDDEAYMGGYIDYYYCFNYVDIEKEMKRDISKDVGIDTAGMSKAGTSDELARIQTMILSNDKSLKESAFYFEDYTKKNDSTKKAVANGLLTVTKAYDRITKSFLVFNVDSTTSDGSKTIPLKGAENDKTEFDTNIRTKYTGKIDTDNVHKDYNYAITQNRINLNELNKIVLEISMPNPNFNLYKFQKVNVQITNPTTTPTNPEEINFRYSGDYIILDINYLWMKGKLSQKVKLVRKEMGKKPEEMTDPKPLEKKKEVKEINENPVGATPSVVLPNSIYTPGESYVVKDKDGKKYIVTIKSLSVDGKEVLADVKQIDGADVSLQGPGATDPNGPGGSTTGTPSVTPGLSSSSTTAPGPNGSSVININWWN
jgi:hypothetical protein